MPTMQEIDEALINARVQQATDGGKVKVNLALLEELCAAARRGVEADALIYAAKVAIPDAEHPVDETISNWAWQIRNLGADRRLEKKRAEKAEAALAEAVRREQDLTRELASSKADADMMARVWQRELCSNGISYQGKSHWIDFMALATKRVVALAMENGVKCCGYPELCTNENCNTLLRQRVEMYRERKGEHDEQH